MSELERISLYHRAPYEGWEKVPDSGCEYDEAGSFYLAVDVDSAIESQQAQITQLKEQVEAAKRDAETWASINDELRTEIHKKDEVITGMRERYVALDKAMLECAHENAELRAQLAQQPASAVPDADRLYDEIHDVLSGYRMSSFVDADGDPFPLVDHLSSGDDISTGRVEIDLICDAIYNDVLAASPTAQAEKEKSK